MENDSANEGTYLLLGKRRLSLKAVRKTFLSLALIIFGFGLGYQYQDLSNYIKPLIGGSKAGEKVERADMDFSLFWQVWDQIKTNYLEPDKIDAKKMMYGAIQGMTASLGDPYTMFLPPSENQMAKEDLNGEFDGIGIQLGYKKDTLAVQTPLPEHPAIKLGVKAGDLILNIKDEAKGIDVDTTGMAADEAVTLIRGKKGTPVTITFYREDKGRFELTIIRDTIKIASVELELGDYGKDGWVKDEKGQVAWLKVRRFGDNTLPEWDEAVAQIIAKRNQGLKGIVLDLRNNPGGYLDAAVSLASEFIPEGKVVERKGKVESKVYTVTKRGRLLGIPVNVLVNGGSASASEILAGALRDRIEAKLVGEKTFGKGTVQDAMDLPGNAGLHLTIAKWLLPSGDWIHEEGIKPDVEVVYDESLATMSGELTVDNQLEEAVKQIKTN